MPRIDESKIQSQNKKFVKKSYRPWNFLEDLEKENVTENLNVINKNDSQLKELDLPIVMDSKPNITSNNINLNPAVVNEDTISVTNQNKNPGQTQDKPRTNIGQTQDKPRTNLRQSQDIDERTPPNSNETDQKPRTNLGLNLGQNPGQSQDKVRTNLGQTQDNPTYYNLTGLQQIITERIYQYCKTTPRKETPPLSVSLLSSECGTSILSVQKTIQRLVKKEIIIRLSFKNGRGGWTIYKINEQIFQEILYMETSIKKNNLGQSQDKLRTNLGQSQDKPGTELKTELRTTPLSSSSYINNTTTTIEEAFILTPDWDLVDISPLAEIGFGIAQLKQLAKAQKLTADQVQESIYAFAYARSKPEITSSIRTSHLAYFMGILIKRGEPYLPPYGYESPKEIALKAELERKKRQLALEEELAEIKFIEWYSSLNPEIKAELTREQASDEDYKLYFESKQIPEHVKESKRKNILRPYYINIICM